MHPPIEKTGIWKESLGWFRWTKVDASPMEIGWELEKRILITLVWLLE